MDSIIVGLISGAVTLAVCLINNHYQRVAQEVKHAETISLVEYRLDQLTKQVEKHNQLVERTDNALIIEWVSSKGSLGTTIIAIL